jgi:hypothetical protein
MRLLAIAALTVATFVSTMLVGHTQANAVVCARGVHRAGCVGRHGAVVVQHRTSDYGYRY